ncbi:hypothetical protein ACFL1Y_01365, partial [Patescibacteria group bacterium]
MNPQAFQALLMWGTTTVVLTLSIVVFCKNLISFKNPIMATVLVLILMGCSTAQLGLNIATHCELWFFEAGILFYIYFVVI